jgi:histidine phosphotransferase ChpT
MSGTHGALRLMELVSAQLCHDIGGLAGTLEQALPAGATCDPDPAKAALDALATRLRLRRAAWGPEAGAVSPERIKLLAQGLPDRVRVDVSALGRGILLSAATGRIVLNLLLLAADSLPAGGVVVLAGAPDDLFVRISGPVAAWPAGLAQCLLNEAEARSALTEPQSLQMGLTALLAHVAGIRLSLLLSPTSQTEPAILRLGR